MVFDRCYGDQLHADLSICLGSYSLWVGWRPAPRKAQLGAATFLALSEILHPIQIMATPYNQSMGFR
jgi:hypothetical protein